MQALHFHHLLLNAGLGVRGAFVVFVALMIMFAGIGITVNLYEMPDCYSVLLLTVFGVGTIRRVALVSGARHARRRVPGPRQLPLD